MRGDGGGVSGLPHDGPHPSHRDSDHDDQGSPGACHDGADTGPSHQIPGADHVRPVTLSLDRIFMARGTSVKEFLNHETDDEQMMVTH